MTNEVFNVKSLYDYFTENKIKARIIVKRSKGPSRVNVIVKVREDRLNQVIKHLESVRPLWINFEYMALNLWDHFKIGRKRKTRLELR